MRESDRHALEAERARRLRRYDQDMASSHPDAHLQRAAIDNCAMCDHDGYRNGHVCDHIDHAPAAKRGIAACRAALTKAEIA
jgi:hypothetical protein